jgi:hypothetical protein
MNGPIRGTAVGPPLTTQGTAAISITQRMPWLGPVRGRVGYVANQWLVYATGGLAYSRIEVNSSASATGFFAPGSLPGALLAQHWGLAQFGALAAAVLRRSDGRLAVAQSWLWVAAGPRSLSTFLLILDHSALVSTGGSCNPAAGTGTIHSRITDNIARVGLNYQFH